MNQCLSRLKTEDTLACGVSRRHARNAPTVLRSEIFCFPTKDNIYYFTIVMPMRLEFVLIDSINEVFGKVLEFGLVMHWNILTQEYTQNAIIYKIIIAEGSIDSESEKIALTFEHFSGAFVIIAVGCALALVAFVMEIVVHSQLNAQTHSKIWRWLHIILKPE